MNTKRSVSHFLASQNNRIQSPREEYKTGTSQNLLGPQSNITPNFGSSNNINL